MYQQFNRLLPLFVLFYSAAAVAQTDMVCGVDTPPVQVKKSVKSYRLMTPNTQKSIRSAQSNAIYPATVLRVQGKAQLIATNGKTLPEPKALSSGDTLHLGDVFQTKEQSFISIQLGDGTISTLPSNSRVELMRSSPKVARVVLQQGSIENRVPKSKDYRNTKFEIQIPNAIIGVRGTDFKVRLAFDGLPSSSSVREGIVSLQSRQNCSAPLLIQAGEGARLDGSGQAHLTSLLAPPTLLNPGVVQAGNDIVFDVQPNVQASKYHAQVAKDAEFLGVVAEAYANQPRLLFNTAAISNGFYYVKLTSFDENGLEGLPKINIFLRAKK